MEIKFFSKYYTNKLYIKIKCNYYYSEKRKKRKCVQSKTIDCDVIWKIKPVKGGWLTLILYISWICSIHCTCFHPFLLKVSLFFPWHVWWGCNGICINPKCSEQNVLRSLHPGSDCRTICTQCLTVIVRKLCLKFSLALENKNVACRPK